MDNKYAYNLSKEEDYSDLINKEFKIYQKKGVIHCKDIEKCLSEKDFYPPDDDRILKSYIEETYDGEFADYCEYIFELYEEEGYYD